MHQYFKFAFLFFLSLVFLPAKAQTDSCWSVLLIKQGNSLELRQNMLTYDPHGFYMVRNCIYQITLKNGQEIGGRLRDIRKDSLVFDNFFNREAADAYGDEFRNVKVHYRQLAELKFLADRSLNLSNTVNLQNFDFHFSYGQSNCSVQTQMVQLFSNSDELYEVVPHLTAQGLGALVCYNGEVSVFWGTGYTKPDESKRDRTFDRRNFIWYTPCNVEEINGLAIGMMPKNIKNQKYGKPAYLVVNGLNIELNPFELVTIYYPQFVGPYSDSLEYFEAVFEDKIETTLNGLSITLVNAIGETQMNGVNFAGLVTQADILKGLSISGFSNFSYKMSGLTIAGLHNKATSGKGVQIALYNNAVDFRGFQIGLWNKNGKRSLPFINWQFKD